jgi:hypothetical protein
VNDNERGYLNGLDLEGLLRYVRNTWGVELAISIDVFTPGSTSARWMCHVQLPNLVHKLELYNPPPYVVCKGGKQLPHMETLAKSCVIGWLDQTQKHLASVNPD